MTRDEAKFNIKWFSVPREEIYMHIDEIYNQFESRCCSRCSTNYKNCSIFVGANELISLDKDNFNCSLWAKRVDK